MRIAIVGGGVAGIAAAYLIQRIHQVSLYEKNDYIGGHTHTITIPDGPDAGTPVDTGFIVFNDRTYPILNRLFCELGVSSRKSDMSFGYFHEKGGFQYATSNFNSLFAQRRNLLAPGYWSMLAEILLFNRLVRRRLQKDLLEGISLGQFLRRFRFSDRFRKQYLFPMVAAIWSAPDVDVGQFPMLTFARFFDNHGLLTIHRHPQWYYVAGGSHTYVKAFLDQFQGEVYTRADIVSIHRNTNGVILKHADGSTQPFDRVVIATHADEACQLLADPSDDERRLLGTWRYSTNQIYLHTDLAWMPSNPNAWASWNIIRGIHSDNRSPVTLTYHMNRLQQLKTRNQYLVTLNPFRPIAEEEVIAQMTYTHPVFTFESLRTQPELPDLNGVRNTFFCGSYFGYGFHEDAARSGVQVAAAMGVRHEL
ncbi:putative amino oxidase [Desulfosarcina variabilis str. Montpellier]|uniref:NAD(P)/FAD-dependent oxidoreductase n=1 Tax=Desulfosarcina variabilis TaxID=2300 RepID=UPI003AFA6830